MKTQRLNPRIGRSWNFGSSLKYRATEFHPYNAIGIPEGCHAPVNKRETGARAGLWSLAVRRCVEIAGPDAQAFTSLLTPCDISKVAVGQCRYLILTNQDGGVLNDPVMLRMADDRFWLSTADAGLYLWVQGVATFSGHDVVIKTPRVYPLHIQGPWSADIVCEVFGDAILDLRYYHWTRACIDGIRVVISRTGFNSELGFEVYLLDVARGDELWDIIVQAGQPLGLSPGSPNRIRRIEVGVLDYGSDMTPNENPLELGMDRLVDFSKRDFIGKLALERVRDRGVSRKMVGVFISGDMFEKNAASRWPVSCEEGRVGAVTNAVYSPRLQRNIGFALVNVSHSAIGTKLRVETPEGLRDIEVTSLPFVDSDKKIPRGSVHVAGL